jgi:hypothetical protein
VEEIASRHFLQKKKRTTERLSFVFIYIIFRFATFACPLSLTESEICVSGKSVIDQRQILFAF